MTTWVWLDERVALAVHEHVLVLHGGLAGVKDAGLLNSALARPKNLSAYVDTADVIDLAAAYTAGIVKDHPFLDGNKRTGFVLGILFLELNGAQFAASEEAAVQAVIGLAPGKLDDAGYAAFLRENTTAE